MASDRANERKRPEQTKPTSMKIGLAMVLMFIDRFETVHFLLFLFHFDSPDSNGGDGGFSTHSQCQLCFYIFHKSITGNGCFQYWLLAISHGIFTITPMPIIAIHPHTLTHTHQSIGTFGFSRSIVCEHHFPSAVA